MKNRNGFVSNSSSSSFIVALPHEPRSKEDLQKMIFGDDTEFEHPYPGYGNPDFFLVEQVIDYIFPNIEQIDSKKIKKLFKDSWEIYYEAEKTLGISRWTFDLPKEEELKVKKLYEEEVERLSSIHTKDFMKRNKHKYFVYFHFSDEDGSLGSACEHGNLFYKLSYTRFSHH